MFKQNKNLVFMVRPARFYSNPQTMETNAFQFPDADQIQVAEKALKEFDALVLTLKKSGISVHVEQDTLERNTPDSIFPNNWISFHEGVVHLYPMCTPNRRKERSYQYVRNIIADHNIKLKYYRDFSFEEKYARYLEGTGSIVFDHTNMKAYACLSERMHKDIFLTVCEALNYFPVFFDAVDGNSKPIYHTNVLMSIGEKFVVICGESIIDNAQKQKIFKDLSKDGKEIFDITYLQMEQFCGNVLQLESNSGHKIIVMSSTAYHSFTPQQKIMLQEHGQLIHSDVSTIEKNGGGSVRCMICEVN